MCVFCAAYSQENSPKLVDFADNFSLYLANLKTKQTAVNTIDIKANSWITNKTKIAYQTAVEYPIKIQFKNKEYASPISRNKVITSRYGWRRGRAHKGIDIDLVTGDSLFAMFDGVVRFSDYSSGHGRTVIVRHFNGLETLYAHLSKYGVKENDTVVAGSYLGKGGASGNARGSHLHLEVTYQGVYINPEYLLNFNEENSINAPELWVTKKWTRPELHSSKRQTNIKLLTTEEEVTTYLNKPAKVYIVKKGDSLSRISARNNISITALCKSNAISRNSKLRIGQRIIIEHVL